MKLYVTNAPVAYDYGYTVTSESMSVSNGYRTTVVRMVQIPAEHADYQVGRYQSGLFFCREVDL